MPLFTDFVRRVHAHTPTRPHTSKLKYPGISKASTALEKGERLRHATFVYPVALF